MLMFDRLLMAAEDNETVADLLDQTLNVARMIDPRADDRVVYGPLQRMHFEWQQMRHRMDEIERRMEQYIDRQNRYGVGVTGTTGYPSGMPYTQAGGYNGTYSPSTSPTSITDLMNQTYMTMPDLDALGIGLIETDTDLVALKPTNAK